ncbi:agamous-like MADS-box protein AGL62 [Lathyrus oleraceus]|uniref:agamous-like MADS-box protein AGL62 n=1 Tax=Pisum sativum TaxID=3888 RepID=UPI001FC4B6DD|nr:agamous-like MADS-box protein AGL62 [Pisum sativum]
MSGEKKSRGRQKIEMKKMSNKSNLQVTFSKRRSGLFKKASDLCILCGVDVALFVFSPSEKVFSFGHPNTDEVIDRYLSQIAPENNNTKQFIKIHRNANVCELNAELTQVNNMLDAEKKLGDQLIQLRKAFEVEFWWACPINGMNRVQMELFKNALKELRSLVAQHVNRLIIQSAHTQTLQFFIGNTSSSNINLHHLPNPKQVQMFQP